MSQLKNIVKLTNIQKDTLNNGGTVSPLTGIDQNTLYAVDESVFPLYRVDIVIEYYTATAESSNTLSATFYTNTYRRNKVDALGNTLGPDVWETNSFEFDEFMYNFFPEAVEGNANHSTISSTGVCNTTQPIYCFYQRSTGSIAAISSNGWNYFEFDADSWGGRNRHAHVFLYYSRVK